MNGIKAVIMAGGFGTRLKPLTDTFPKPLAPVLNEPVMAHILRHLCRNGINDAAVTLKHMPEMIKNTFGDLYAGVNLKYYTEETPLGTAGGVKACEDFLSDDFIVASGDGIWDYDLKEAYEYHKKMQADVTIISAKTHTPMLYGVIMAEKNGKISRFAEKPSWGEVFSNRINTGIYIIKKDVLKYVPTNTMFDFSKDLFPLLMKNDKRLFAFEGDGAWCDIGNLEEYRKCNIEALNGKYSLNALNNEQIGVINSVIGEGMHLGKNATVNSAVIHDDVTVQDGATVRECIICRGVVIGKNANIQKGCVIGAGSIIGDGITLEENTVIPTGSIVNGDELMRNVIKKGTLFGSDGIKGELYGNLGNDGVCALGSAIGVMYKTAGVICDGSPMASAASEIFACGVKYSGCKCMKFKDGFYHMANFINMYYRLDVMVYIKKDTTGDKLHFILRDKNGLKIKASEERKIEDTFFSRTVLPPCDIYETETIQGADELYKSALVNQMCKGTENELENVNICIRHSKECRLLSGVLSALGADVHEYTSPNSDEYFCIDIESDSDNIRFSQVINGSLFVTDKYHMVASIIALEDEESINTLALSYYDPPIYAEIAKKRGINAVFYLDSPSSEIRQDNLAREAFYKNIFKSDPLACTVKLLSILKKHRITLEEAVKKVRPFFVREDNISVPYEERAEILSRLYEDNIPYQRIYGDGVIIKKDNATSTVGFADKGFRVITEGYNASASSDIVSEIIAKINEKNKM